MCVFLPTQGAIGGVGLHAVERSTAHNDLSLTLKIHSLESGTFFSRPDPLSREWIIALFELLSLESILKKVLTAAPCIPIRVRFQGYRVVQTIGPLGGGLDRDYVV